MDELKISTNYHWRNTLYGHELTDTERAEFDYLEPDDLDMRAFIRYRGHIYDLGEFMRCPDTSEACNTHANNLAGWHGYQSDSVFSGVCVRYSDDYEQIQIGTYYS